jgi:hypothetical protein
LLTATAGPAIAQGTVQPFVQTGQPPASLAEPAGAAPIVPPPAQSPVPSASPSVGLVLPQPPALPPPPTEKRGFLTDFGTWWNKSVADFNAKMKEQQSTLEDLNKQSAAATKEAMKNAADAMVRLPSSRVIEIHEVCATAGNGAPDCGPAVTNACRAKGFNSGQPVDISTVEKCTASLWMSGQAQARDCPVETVVLRAACQ